MASDPTAYRYCKALIPVNWTICGVVLRPFSLGHFLILEQIQNPIINESERGLNITDGMYWFFQALIVCAQDYKENIYTLSTDETQKEVFDKFTVNLLKNMDCDKSWNIFDKFKLFKEYMAYYMDIPIYSEEKTSNDNKMPSGTDWKQNIYLTFKKLGYSEEEILNMPFKRLFYEWCSHAESEGAIKVMNKYDLDSLNFMKGIR